MEEGTHILNWVPGRHSYPAVESPLRLDTKSDAGPWHQLYLQMLWRHFLTLNVRLYVHRQRRFLDLRMIAFSPRIFAVWPVKPLEEQREKGWICAGTRENIDRCPWGDTLKAHSAGSSHDHLVVARSLHQDHRTALHGPLVLAIRPGGCCLLLDSKDVSPNSVSTQRVLMVM